MMLTIAAVVSLLLALLSIVYALKGLPNDKIIFHSMSRLIIKRSSINSAGMALHSTREPFDRNKKPVAGPPPPINEFIKADKVKDLKFFGSDVINIEITVESKGLEITYLTQVLGRNT